MWICSTKLKILLKFEKNLNSVNILSSTAQIRYRIVLLILGGDFSSKISFGTIF